MNKKIYLTAFLVFGMIIGFSLREKDSSSTSKAPVEKLLVQKEEIRNAPSVETTDKSNSSISSAEINKLHENLPDETKVNEDLKSSPHTPSKTLMTFARSLGPMMEKAFENERDADILIKELSECANNESLANSARAMCVKNTERLAEKHSMMQKTAKDLRDSVSPEVQKILDTNERFIKK